MDPDATLREMRELARETDGGWLTEAQSDRFAELFTALDEWLVDGGFLPKDWA